MTQTQMEAARALAAVHREQDISHLKMVQRHKEIMDLAAQIEQSNPSKRRTSSAVYKTK